MFRAVGCRCAVDFSELHLPISDLETLALLASMGFKVIEVDLVQIARSRIGVSRYRRGARLIDAPDVFDCSSFMKWLYAHRGVWLPRRTIQQIELGTAVPLSAVVAGDAIFTTGSINYYHDDPAQGVGHVGIATGEGTVAHAANKRAGIIETDISKFVLSDTKLRGVRRYISDSYRVVTLETPPSREVEVSDDIRWIVLQQLASK